SLGSVSGALPPLRHSRGSGATSSDPGHRLRMRGDFPRYGASSRDVRQLLRMWAVVSGYTLISPDVARRLGMRGVVSGAAARPEASAYRFQRWTAEKIGAWSIRAPAAGREPGLWLFGCPFRNDLAPPWDRRRPRRLTLPATTAAGNLPVLGDRLLQAFQDDGRPCQKDSSGTDAFSRT